MEVSGQPHALAALFLGKEFPSTHWIGGWVGPRAGLDVVAKKKSLPMLGIEPGCSICNQLDLHFR